MRKVRSNVMLVLHNMTIEPSFARKKKWTTKHDKSTVTYDFGTAQFEDGTIKCKKKKKIRVQLNVAKVLSCVMLILLNVIKDPLSVRKRWGNYWMWQKYNHMWCWYCSIWWWNCQMWVKIKVPSNVTKVRSNKMLVLPNVTMKPSNVRKK